MPYTKKSSFSRKFFMQKYNVSEQNFKKAAITWDELLAIKMHFESHQGFFKNFSNEILNSMNMCGAIHSVKVRIKNSEHLIEKIIRKNIESINDPDAGAHISYDNYTETLNDIIGIRVLHLFKDDWVPIHSFIRENFPLASTPCAYIREGDLKNIIDAYEKNGCIVLKHPFGYRSVHYVTFNENKTLRAEIQVRTLFEEAWSEIDHTLRYPYFLDDEILKTYSLMLNRLAGSADEVSTYIKIIKAEIENMKYDSVEKNIDFLEIIEKKNKEIEELRSRLEKAEASNCK
ncbi:MAG TPA: GTP pyrophosphokinase [Candidatus Wallbacteria bacterium]|nr:GTP pyrophosphokinase [Candidatus Wallbacteria bacterium]